jgi:hypothetical protein
MASIIPCHTYNYWNYEAIWRPVRSAHCIFDEIQQRRKYQYQQATSGGRVMTARALKRLRPISRRALPAIDAWIKHGCNVTR